MRESSTSSVFLGEDSRVYIDRFPKPPEPTISQDFVVLHVGAVSIFIYAESLKQAKDIFNEARRAVEWLEQRAQGPLTTQCFTGDPLPTDGSAA